jgi:endonuclease YncB( thermonuclease family)
MAVPEAPPAPAAGGRRLDGRAIVTAALELNVDGKPLRLAGVKVPAAGDMCTPGAAYAARACPDVSRQALAALVGPKGPVSCRIIAVGGAAALPAVCTDRKGDDLGSYLVAHGFALADGNDMVDYSAAEDQAKAAHSGLWHYR